MELFTALLTGFFFWLWLFHLQRGRRARAREAAGPLLLEVRVARRLVCRLRWVTLVLIVYLLAVPAMNIGFLYHMHASNPSFPDLLRISSYSFTTFVAIAGYFWIFLLVALPLTSPKVAFEMREHGILLGMGWLKFVPWSRITECRWFLAKTRLARWLLWGVPKPYKHSRFTIVERRIATEQKDHVTAVLAHFAPVYDHDGTLLARPSEADVAAQAARPVQDRSRFMFQFDLQSLMLLVVVVSCGASCYGIHLRRLEPQLEAIAHLRAFQSSVDDFDGVPWRLDFSKCAVKPTDSDLVYLEPLSELSMLDLSGAPVTDAGLVHLMGLKRLDFITLKDTAVTSKGAAELNRSLPNADIFYGPGNRREWFGPANRPGAATPGSGK
jgi:hypothetical protein